MESSDHSKEIKTHDIFVPLVSFVIVNSGSKNSDGETVRIKHRYPINGSINLCHLSSGITLKEIKDIELSRPLVLNSDGKTFVVRDMINHGVKHQFNSGLLLKYLQRSPNQISIFPNSFENAVRGALTSLRLFTPGDIYAPYALVDGIDVVHLHEFNGGLDLDGNSGYIYENQINDFINFHGYCTKLTNALHEAYKEGTNKLLISWYKRINNAIYFFNQTYFSNESNIHAPEARNGNQLRLIFLCTALDGLLGSGNSSGKELAENASQVLGKISPKVKDDVLKLYDLRSRYIHANPHTLQNIIKDQDVARLKAIVQKVILVSLTLSSNEVYVSKLSSLNKKHWFGLLSDPNIENSLRESVKSILALKDKYEVTPPDPLNNLMNIWERGI